MKLRSAVMLAALVLSLGYAAGSEDGGKAPPLRLFFSEVQAGAMASEQSCALVFGDRHFHYERAVRSVGRDRDRKVYEGELSQFDWDALSGALDSKEFRDLKIPQGAPPVVLEDAHTITISVGRENDFQNMEFLDNKSRKPYEPQLKPLLRWWKSFRGSRMQESKARPDARCALDSTSGVLSH